ncbi:MAG: aspartyl/glutamyl-tRNA(Asn/Gln) amidotransferase subunit B [Planctomycetota bacterium]|nr:MAG: aspartyl/glutamyl-tRNA(Asn/Gln) amidotransferase subunit B [Planctomycetota bacterium]
MTAAGLGGAALDSALAQVRARYETVIGIEVHAQLATRTKLFCGCATSFGEPANTRTCPVCLGLPGVLPVLNRQALELCLLAAMALGCTVPERTQFDRKNYYYPDLPKNYQISQNYVPLGRGGVLELLQSGKSIGIDNVHLEEDAGKLLHEEGGGERSLIDLNRAGVPLAEIVSAPELRSLAEVEDYMETLRLTLLYLGVSRCRMQEGNLRFEASISLRPHGASGFGPRVEIKNLNSFKAVLGALAHEVERQAAALERGEPLAQETRLWDEARGVTERMRTKEQAHDYRYFPEPDLPPLAIDAALRERVRARLVELPAARRRRFMEQLGLSAYDAGVLLSEPALASYFEELAQAVGEAKAAANWLINDVLGVLNARKLEFAAWSVPAPRLAELIALTARGEVSGLVARQQLLPRMLETGETAPALIQRLGLAQQSDREALLPVVERVLAEHPRPVEQYLGGKTQTLGFLIGQCMKSSQGRGNPKVFAELLREELERRRG